MTPYIAESSRPTPAWDLIHPIRKENASHVVHFHRNALFHEGTPVIADRTTEHCETIWQDFFNHGKTRGERAFKIEQNGEMAGFIHYGPIPAPDDYKKDTHCAAIHQLYIKSENRCHGFGTSFFNYAFRSLQEKKLDVLFVSAQKNSDAAHYFLEKQHATKLKDQQSYNVPSTLYAINLQRPQESIEPFMKQTLQAVPA